MEALASLVSVAKRNARGYPSQDPFVRMAYLIAGKWDMATARAK